MNLQPHEFGPDGACKHCGGSENSLVSRVCAARSMEAHRLEQQQVQASKQPLTLCAALDWCRENDAVLRFADVPSNGIRCVVASVGVVTPWERRAAVGETIEDAVATLIRILERDKNQPKPQQPPSSAPGIREDMEILDRVLEISIPSMSPDQSEQLEGLIFYLKERVSQRRVDKEEWRKNNRVLGPRQEVPDSAEPVMIEARDIAELSVPAPTVGKTEEEQ